ncbi:hypothetical protein MRX96_051739 [Rhipicephalus microplus]
MFLGFAIITVMSGTSDELATDKNDDFLGESGGSGGAEHGYHSYACCYTEYTAFNAKRNSLLFAVYYCSGYPQFRSNWCVYQATTSACPSSHSKGTGSDSSDYKTDFPTKADYFKADSETDSRTTTLYHTDNCKPNYSRATTLYHTDNCKPNYSHATTHYHTDNCKPNCSHTTTHYHTDNCKPNYSRTTTHYHTDNCKHNYSSTSDHKTTSTCKKYTK